MCFIFHQRHFTFKTELGFVQYISMIIYLRVSFSYRLVLFYATTAAHIHVFKIINLWEAARNVVVNLEMTKSDDIAFGRVK